MAFNGSGTFNLVAGNPVVTGTTISSTWANNTLSDIATGLSSTITKDGQTTPTANIPMGAFKFTGLGAGTAAGNSLRWEQLFSQGAPVTLASAATTDIGVQTSVAVEITGTTTITSFGTNYNGPRFLRFTGALVLTHNATTLNLPGAANITTVAGDTCTAYPNSASNGWNVVEFQRSSALPALSGANSNITSLTGLTSSLLTSGTAQATTSGVSKIFTGLPTWVKRVTLSLSKVSTNGTANLLITIGPSGGVETTSYEAVGSTLANTASVSTATATTGFPITIASAGNSISGSVVFTLLDAATNTWVCNGVVGSSANAIFTVNGYKALAGVLERIQIATSNGTDAFDAGSINILYE